jgi:formyltetrahydrofolate synthetase
MALDVRLECLMIAINEDCSDLEANEVNGTLVVRLKDGVKIEIVPKKRGRPAWLHAEE